MQKKVIDLSRKLYTGMPTYAGDKPNPEIISRPSKLAHDITISWRNGNFRGLFC